MKFTIIGIVFIITSVAVAGNWLYAPLSIQTIEEEFKPIAHFPEGDEADEIFHSNLTYIPSLDMYYIEWNYVWVNISGHAPDTEEIRIYIKNGSVHHISLRIHYEWMDIEDFEVEDTHVHINFAPVYHTPYTTKGALMSSTMARALPIVFPMVLGIGFIAYDIRRKGGKNGQLGKWGNNPNK